MKGEERENSRERKPGSLGREESQVVVNSRDPGRDVRESLFSVFIDNLNPRLDSLGLWEVFELYGKVRDVYLSPKKSSRRSWTPARRNSRSAWKASRSLSPAQTTRTRLR